MHGHRDLDLLSANQSLKVRMDQTSTNRINLPIVKHHFATGPALDFNRKDRVPASLRSQNCRQFLKGREGSFSLTFSAIDRHRHHACFSCASSVILAAAFACFGSNRNLLMLCHACSSSKGSAISPRSIFDLRLPIFDLKNGPVTLLATVKTLAETPRQQNRKSAITKQKSAVLIADGLLFKPSVFALHTKSEETLVSSWIDLIAFARSGAILSTLIFFNSHA